MIIVGRVISLLLCLFAGIVAWCILFAVITMSGVGLMELGWWPQNVHIAWPNYDDILWLDHADFVWPKYADLARLAQHPLGVPVLLLAGGYPMGVILLLFPGIRGWWIKIRIGARKPSGRERAQFDNAETKLRQEYQTLYERTLPRVRWQVVDSDELNAMVFHGRQVVATNHLLRFAREDDEVGDDLLYGILAHELGHLHYGDASHTLRMLALLWPLSPLILTTHLFLFLCRILSVIPIVAIVIVPFYWIFVTIIWTSLLPEKIAWFVSGMTNRAIEFRADRFAFDMHGKRGLQLFLEKISGEDFYAGGTIMDYYQRSHPPVELRLDRLDRLSEEVERATRQPC